jgi:sensor domain CHASE-containing protein
MPHSTFVSTSNEIKTLTNKIRNMTKILLMLAITISTMSAFASETEIDAKVLEAFKTEFAAAKEVSWSEAADHYKAEFTFNGQHVKAYYSKEGELLGLTRYITSIDLPLSLQTSLKKTYSDFWISDLFEATKDNGTTYYITLEDADTQVVMKASAGESWSVYKKIKKA